MANNYIVLGANGGIGAETCNRLRDGGDNVFLAGRNQEQLETLSKELDSPMQVLDATDIQQVESCCEQATSEFGQLHGIVNCVGSVLLKPAHLTTANEWNETIATNLTSAFATVRAGYKSLKGHDNIIKASASVIKLSSLPRYLFKSSSV